MDGHGYHHRHFMGKVEAVDLDNYEAIFACFHEEAIEL